MSDPLALVTTAWGLVMSLAPLLQVRVILRERDSRGTSVAWVLILVVGFSLWFAYGVAHDLVPVMVTNVVSLSVALVLLVAARRHRTGPGGPVGPPDLSTRNGGREPT